MPPYQAVHTLLQDFKFQVPSIFHSSVLRSRTRASQVVRKAIHSRRHYLF